MFGEGSSAEMSGTMLLLLAYRDLARGQPGGSADLIVGEGAQGLMLGPQVR